MVNIRLNLKVAQDKKKSYADKMKTYMELKVGEHVILKLKAKKSLLRLGSCPKLAARYWGSFEFLENIRPLAYMILFLTSMIIHNVFHLPLLNKYVLDPNHVMD